MLLEIAVVREWHPEGRHRFWSGLVHAHLPMAGFFRAF
jgi:hypothetical protein